MAYRIRELREKKKLTQEQLAQMSGVSRTTIVLLENNEEHEATDKKYTEEELNALTVAQIKAIAAERGYDLKETVKAKLIAEFLTQQG